MIIVNSPGNASPYSWLTHSTWDGCSLADLVFPFFLGIVGISCYVSLHHNVAQIMSPCTLIQKITKRCFYLFSIGLLLNAFPYHFDLSTLRIPGVLQRIALCYGIVATLSVTTSIRTQWLIVGLLLVGYWLILLESRAGHPWTITQNITSLIDRKLLTPQHLYTQHYDPEGLLSTLPAIASCLLGNLIGYTLMQHTAKQQQFYHMIMFGSLLCALGWIWSFYFPLNKTIWSSSYVLWTSGLCTLLFAGCFWLVDIKQIKRWTQPFTLMGKNALLIYVVHIILLKIQFFVPINHGNGQLSNVRDYLTNTLFSGLNPQNAALSYACIFTLFCYSLLLLKKTHYPPPAASRESQESQK